MARDIKGLLACSYESPGKRSSSFPKRLHNIMWAHGLSKTGLSYPDRVRTVEVYQTPAHKSVLLRYPGKETKRGGDAQRPFDFFPVLYRGDCSRMDDLRFGQVFASFQELADREGVDFMHILAACVYRMAFMLDHVLNDSPTLAVRDHPLESQDDRREQDYSHRKHSDFYVYTPRAEVEQRLAVMIPSLRVSADALLKYCEVFAWNEDSKYYYRALKRHADAGKTGSPPWISATGRINTLLTGLTVVGYEAGVIPFPALIDRFTAQRGVAPASNPDITQMTDGIVRASI